MHRKIGRKRVTLLSRLSFPVLLLGAFWGTAAAGGITAAQASTVTTSSLGRFSPTFAGPAATGCAEGCSLLSGPFDAPSIASSGSDTASLARASLQAGAASSSGPQSMPAANPVSHASISRALRALAQPTGLPLPSVRCPGPGCDSVSKSAGGATGVKGLNAVDSSLSTTNIFKNVEPPDQGLCAGNGSVVETNNIGEILIFDTSLARQSAPISLDAVMGLAGRGWSSGGDPSCVFDTANGGHWFFTEFVSASTEASGGPFSGCFAAVANTCYEGIAVSQGSSPFGPYFVYFLNANYNPAEPGYPFLLNDFAKISVTRDAFLLFYDEFPLNGGGFGGGLFNGAQEYAFTKSAFEQGRPVTRSNGRPNRSFSVAIENMGLVPTPDGTCASTSPFVGFGGVTCWAAAIPAQPADAGQYDNRNGGSGFMMDTLDFNNFFGGLPTSGDNRIAVWAWTGLSNLRGEDCCDGIHFSGQLFSGVETYNDPQNFFGVGVLGAQKAGPIPLGDQCGATIAGAVSPCPEGGIESNADFMTQVSQAQGQLWGSTPTEISQTFGSDSEESQGSEVHLGVAYWVVGTGSFDSSGQFSLTNQGYVSAAHADVEMAAMAGEGTGGNGQAIMVFTLNGAGSEESDHGGFFPSTAYGRLTATSNGLSGSVIHIADAGQSPQDGFSEYQQVAPGVIRPRWGDYSWAIFLPGSGGRIYFANEYIQYPNCAPPAFQLHKIGTCGGTRNSLTNWGTSVNYVVP